MLHGGFHVSFSACVRLFKRTGLLCVAFFKGTAFACLDAFLTFEDAVILLFGERWVLDKEHERKRMRQG